VSAQQLLARLVDELPTPERVEPFAYLEDELLPPRITLVEPTAFALACVQAAWVPTGLRTDRARPACPCGGRPDPTERD
jgi:hypothetical protein